jgi:amino acid adenylation domain-containing protein
MASVMDTLRSHVVSPATTAWSSAKPGLEEHESALQQALWAQLCSMGLAETGEAGFDEIMSRLGIVDTYERWLAASLAVFVEQGWLRLQENRYAVVFESAPDAETTQLAWEHPMEEWRRDQDMGALLRLEADTMRVLPEILTGSARATDVIFPNGSMELVEGVHTNNAVVDYFNDAIAGLVEAFVQARLAQDADTPVRILEIGAGTGGTSAAVFARLEPNRRHIAEYCYTDLTETFLTHARRSYDANASYLETRILDIQRPLAAQGLKPGQYDMVIATNVLHATPNIRWSLRNAKAALRRHGVLLLNELSKGSLSAHVTFGLLDGWWLFEDTALRIPGGPVLSPETWVRVLKREGFDNILLPLEQSRHLGQQIIVAESDGIVRQRLQPGGKPKRATRPAAQPKPLAPEPKGVTPESKKDLSERVQAALIEVISRQLKLRADAIDPVQEMSDYGVDSISSMQFANELNARYGLELSPLILFEQPTLAGLAQSLVQTHGDSLAARLAPPDADSNPADKREHGVPARQARQRRNAHRGTTGEHTVMPAERPPALAAVKVDAPPPIEAVGRNTALPLSFGQQRLWFLAQFEGGSAAYHLSSGFRLRRFVNHSAFIKALGRIVDRHESLRTRFLPVDGEPVQSIGTGDGGFALIEHDLRNRADADAELERIVALEAATPFDLEQGPLIRGRLLRLGDEEHVFLLTMHHIISDGWSIGVFYKELGVLYSAFARDEDDPLPPLPVQYADYAHWQRRWLEGEEGRRQAAYWKGALTGAPELLNLPTDHPRPATQDHAGASLDVRLDATLTRDLKALSRRHGVTLYVTLLAGLAATLSRLSGQQDVVIGTPTANRIRPELEGLIGYFVNTLALRLDLSGAPSTAALLEQTKRVSLEGQNHWDIPFEQVVETVRPARSLAHEPLFQVMLSWLNVPLGKQELPDLMLSPIQQTHTTSQFDLLLMIGEEGDEIAGYVEYATALFEPETIGRYVDYWRRLLEEMTAEETRPVDAIPLLSARERRQVLVDWNATETEYPADKCLHELFEAQVDRTPDTVALVYEQHALTYAQLNEQANRLAHHLRTLGVGPDTRLAICIERSLEMVVGLLAILKAGGAYVPLDPAYPADRLGHMLADCAPLAVLTDSRSRSLLEALDLQAPLIDLQADAPKWAEQSGSDLACADIGLKPEHLAYVIYTSGSTGAPKGAMNEHRGVVNRLHWMQSAYRLNDGDAVLQKTPFSFDVSVWEFFWPLLSGARLVMARPEGHKNPAYLVDIIRDAQITTLHFVPSMLQAFLEDEGCASCAGVVRVICSGEALQATLVRRFHDRLPAAELHNLYGPTEAAVDVTAWRCDTQAELSSIPIGRPIANTRIYILDGHREPVPIGVAGEIHIGGVQVGRGYLNRPELSAERFLADPFSAEPGARVYRTGDLGRWLADGNIEYLGRNDFQVKIRGFRIELGEIETRLVEHPAIREAVVLAFDEGDDKRLVAYYVSDKSLEVGALRLHLAASLPEYMVPAAFVRLASLPLSPNGKLDRKALPAPEGDAYSRSSYEAPQGEVEEALARVWTELLKVERIGRNDNFFELGGHSLMAVKLIERMRRDGLSTDAHALFAAPTLAGLAAACRRERDIEIPPNLIPEGCDNITPAMLPLIEFSQDEIDRVTASVPGGVENVQDIYPLAPLQEGVLFHHMLEKEGDAYLMCSLLTFAGRKRLDEFLTALQAVIDRHDVLRTAVAWEGLSQPAQVVWRRAPLAIEEVEFDTAAGDVAEQLQKRFDPRRWRLDVRQAPLIRAFFARDSANGRWLLLLLHHHLMEDVTTVFALFKEIRAHILGEADRLPASIPFRDFVVKARQGASPAEHEAFFQSMLGDVDEPTTPFGLLNAQGDGAGIEESLVALDPDLARRLRKQARQLGVSTASLFHLAWALVVARTSGRDDVVFGTVLFGRMQGEGERALGMFINTLPLRIRIGEESVEESARRVHEALAELLGHEHAPLTLAQRCSGVPAPTPLFSALLNYRHSWSEEMVSDLALDGIDMLSMEERTNYPLGLSVDDLGEDFTLTAQTPKEVGAARLCRFLERALAGLADALERTPEMVVRRIDVLPEAEQRKLVVEWNETATAYPMDKCVHELFEAQVERTPEAMALAFEDHTLSYAELNRRANRLAHYLRDLGVEPDERVAICVERSIEMIVGLLAILKAGGAYVPLDPAYPPERLAYMLEDSAPMVLLTQTGLKEAWVGYGDDSPVIILDAELAPWADLPETNLTCTETGLTAGHLAYVIYTSGSTGKPKGVMVEHRGLANLAKAQIEAFAVEPGSRILQFASFSFDACISEVLMTLHSGASLQLVRDVTQLTGETLLQTLREHQITHVTLTPALLSVLPEQAEMDSVQCLIVAGEALSASLVRRWAPGRRLMNAYGPTEATVCAAMHRCDAERDGSPPIGRPMANTRIYILDPQCQPVPIGVAGEIYIGGAGVARGYLNRPELTQARFLADPFAGEPGARMYKTGDLGRWLPDGTIEFLGRNDFQVKLRGFRIEPGEIEARLSALDSVREAAVILREEGGKQLVAYYVEERKVGADVLRSHLAETLPEHMIPSAYVPLDALPLTPNGKLDRKALPAPEGDAYVRRDYTAPVGELEASLARIWAELLGLDHVGRHDNFFELGGHSLLAVQLVSRLEQESLATSLASVFAYPTIIELANHMMSKNDVLSELGVVPLREEQPPLFLIPDIFGETLYGPLITRNLARGFQVYGLSLYRSEEKLFHTIEEMARHLRQTIQAIQPAGPYRLAGWSFGGKLAYEIAAQLIDDGQDVQFLGLLDTYYTPPTLNTIEEEAPQPQANNTMRNAEGILPDNDITEAYVSYLKQAFQESTLAPGGMMDSEIDKYLFRFRTHAQANIAYSAKSIPITVHFFAAQEEAPSELMRGWNQVLPASQIHVIPVEGSHMTMIQEPYVDRLSAAMSHAIDQSKDIFLNMEMTEKRDSAPGLNHVTFH